MFTCHTPEPLIAWDSVSRMMVRRLQISLKWLSLTITKRDKTMPEDFSTRDVLGQVDARLNNMEQDLRAFSSEFGNVRSGLSALTRWGLGMMFASWMTVIASIWLKS